MGVRLNKKNGQISYIRGIVDYYDYVSIDTMCIFDFDEFDMIWDMNCLLGIGFITTKLKYWSLLYLMET